MEDLSKTQIVLLSLLVSFVSSVAISIITYSLLSEAPTPVIQTVNRVVERTIETVVPNQSKEIVNREVTVVVKEEDLVIEAIAKNEPGLVRIWTGLPGAETKTFLSLGLILSKDGFIVSPKTGETSSLSAVFSDGRSFAINRVGDTQSFSFYKVVDVKEAQPQPIVLGDSNVLQLGQTIISIRGEDQNSVAVGRVTGFSDSEDQSVSKFNLVETELPVGTLGSPIVNLKGDVVGFNIDGTNKFIPSNIIKSEAEGIDL